MTERLVTLEEARALLEAATPGPWRSAWEDAHADEESPVIYSLAGDDANDMGGRVVFGMWYDGPMLACTQPDAALVAAAPDLARTVVIANADLLLEQSAHAETKAERDRLARVLAVERGDETQAPEGWERRLWGWAHPSGREVRPRFGPPHEWSAWTGPRSPIGVFATALDALEAADAVKEER